MEKIQIKNRFTSAILFEHEAKNNSIKETICAAVNLGTVLRGADLRGADLRGADLRGAYLSDAVLRGAHLGDAYLNGTVLSGADLSGAYLRGADLSGADLSGADLSGADLSGADLSDTDLSGAYLRGTDLHGTDLRGAVLSGAVLSGADLSGAYLRGADLRGADLSGAYLSGADLSDAKEAPYFPIACPSDGAFIGWKKVEDCIIQLLIPEDAKRCSANSQKCRCEFAKVVSITRIDNGEELQSIENISYTPFIVYKVGEIVKPDSFDENRWNECSHGIHFFINKQDAIDY